jgi:hypothetical protein
MKILKQKQKNCRLIIAQSLRMPALAGEMKCNYKNSKKTPVFLSSLNHSQ